jgi:RNA polymerase sigma-70 factor (ECF subfamily)
MAVSDRDQYRQELPGRDGPAGSDVTTGFDNEEAENFEDAEQLRDAATPEDELHGKQIANTVNKAMDALPEDLRTAITLREIEGLSYEEIANVMNCPIGTVLPYLQGARSDRGRAAAAAGTEKDRRW